VQADVSIHIRGLNLPHAEEHDDALALGYSNRDVGMGLEAITVAPHRDAAGVLPAVVPGPVVIDAEVGIGVAAENGIDDVIFGEIDSDRRATPDRGGFDRKLAGVLATRPHFDLDRWATPSLNRHLADQIVYRHVLALQSEGLGLGRSESGEARQQCYECRRKGAHHVLRGAVLALTGPGERRLHQPIAYRLGGAYYTCLFGKGQRDGAGSSAHGAAGTKRSLCGRSRDRPGRSRTGFCRAGQRWETGGPQGPASPACRQRRRGAFLPGDPSPGTAGTSPHRPPD